MTTNDGEVGAQRAVSAQAAIKTPSARAAASLHTGENWEQAAVAALAGLGSEITPDLTIVFIDSLFAGHYEQILALIRQRTGAAHVVGCSGQSVIGSGVEMEDSPAVALLSFQLPQARFRPLAIVPGKTVEADLAALDEAGADMWLIFADPFSINAEALVQELQARRPGVTLVGGLASAHNQADGTAVFLDNRALADGAVLLGLRGVELHAIVAQGAEPLGDPWTITACQGNTVQTIGSRPALEVLTETLAALDEETRDRAQANLLVGLAMDEYRAEHGRGDFLIRNIVGADRAQGAIAINATPRVGQTLQFQFRDAAAADQDLRQRLADFRAGLRPDQTVLGALLCSCNGRGEGLFGVPHHDAAALAEALGPIPTAGLFCNGEIGPVGGSNFVHGFTASIALLTAPAG